MAMNNTTPIDSQFSLFVRSNIQVSADELRYINASPLLLSLLHWYAEQQDNKSTPVILTRDSSADSSAYDSESHNINLKQTGSDFVRVLGHELAHAYDQLEQNAVVDKIKDFAGIIHREMDESEATATSYIIRCQIMSSTGEDIGIGEFKLQVHH